MKPTLLITFVSFLILSVAFLLIVADDPRAPFPLKLGILIATITLDLIVASLIFRGWPKDYYHHD